MIEFLNQQSPLTGIDADVRVAYDWVRGDGGALVHVYVKDA